MSIHNGGGLYTPLVLMAAATHIAIRDTPMKLADLIKLYREPGEDGLPEDYADLLEQAVAENASVAEAKIVQLEELNQEQQNQITGLKTELYDMSRLLPATEADTSEDESEAEEEYTLEELAKDW